MTKKFKTFKEPSPERMGKLFEYDLFDTIKPLPEMSYEQFKTFKKSHLKDIFGKRRVTKEECFEFIKNFQPSDPYHPTKKFSRELRFEIVNKLKLSQGDVKFYTAVESPIDKDFSVDAWFEIRLNKNEPWRRVTLDASLRPEQKEGRPGHVIVGDVPDPTMSKKEYLKKVEEVANEVIMMAGGIKMKKAA